MNNSSDPRTWSSLASTIYEEAWPLIPTYTHLVLSALFPIYAGAHASLSRPSSAAKPAKRSKSTAQNDEEEDEEDEDQVQRMEGLSPSDALMFPLLAGCTLAGLYFLIKWLQDPTLLNKILNAYFAIFGTLSVAKLVADCLGFVQGMMFPSLWVDRNGTVWNVRSKERRVTPFTESASGKADIQRSSPLPGVLAALPLLKSVEDRLWLIREAPQHKWTLQLYVQHIMAGKVHIGINGFIGIFVALVAVMYFNLVDKPWWLTNLMGFGFSYGAMQLLSPTTFSTGALILSALFFYDIYFVFYTPMMVTVAKSLDIPIKLLFPRPPAPGEPPEKARRAHAMLGLGDVVLPGIMIGLALRYDLFTHYLRKQKKRDSNDSIAADSTLQKNNVTDVSKVETDPIKAPYKSLSGKYGDAFWTHSWFGRSLLPSDLTKDVSRTNPGARNVSPETSFPKPYFHASVIGYIIGMLTTLAIMHIFGHAQPALLYLVPGVLGSLFLTGLVRGELIAMWDYTELEEENEEEEKKKPSDSNSTGGEKAVKSKGTKDGQEQDGPEASKKSENSVKQETTKVGKHEEKVLIRFSVSKRDIASDDGGSKDAKKDV